MKASISFSKVKDGIGYFDMDIDSYDEFDIESLFKILYRMITDDIDDAGILSDNVFIDFTVELESNLFDDEEKQIVDSNISKYIIDRADFINGNIDRIIIDIHFNHEGNKTSHHYHTIINRTYTIGLSEKINVPIIDQDQ